MLGSTNCCTVLILGGTTTCKSEGTTPLHSLAADFLFWEYADEHPDAPVVIIHPSVVFDSGNPNITNIYR